MPKSKRIAREIEEIQELLNRDIPCDQIKLSWYVGKIESINERYCREKSYLMPAYKCFCNNEVNKLCKKFGDDGIYEYYKNHQEELKEKVAISKRHLRSCIANLQALMERIPQR